jgi:hypothetical protein
MCSQRGSVFAASRTELRAIHPLELYHSPVDQNHAVNQRLFESPLTTSARPSFLLAVYMATKESVMTPRFHRTCELLLTIPSWNPKWHSHRPSNNSVLVRL